MLPSKLSRLCEGTESNLPFSLSHFLTFLFLILVINNSGAQPLKYSVKEAVEYAYEHRSAVQQAKLDVEIADARVKEVTGIGLPQLNAAFDVKDFEKIPTTTFPDFLSPAVYNILYDEGLVNSKPAGSPAQIPLQFGTKWNATASVNASQLLFNPTYLVGVKATKTYRELSQKNLTASRIETQAIVTKAYYNVLVNRERHKLLEANVVRLKKLKEDTKALYENGFVEKTDNDRITLAYNTINIEQENVSRLVKLSEYLLLFQMGAPASSLESPLELTDTLSDEDIRNISISAEKPDISGRIEYSALKTQQQLLKYDLKRYKVAYYPTLAAYGSVSANALRDEFDIFDTDKKWYPSALIGATLSINLFDGTQRERRIRQASLNLKKIDYSLENAESALTLEALTARTMLQNAVASYSTQKDNLALADEIVRVSKLKFDQGVGSSLEIITAETSLREARTNYYNALYDVLVARTDLDKALGRMK